MSEESYCVPMKFWGLVVLNDMRYDTKKKKKYKQKQKKKKKVKK